MTIIVWDGKTLAADKQSTANGQKIKSTKIFKWKGHLVGGSGTGVLNEAMFQWFKDGADPDKFPDYIEVDSEDDSHLIVITPKGKILNYENNPYPMDFTENGKLAIGCGAPYAYAALSMGADAVRAVEVAIENDTNCGMGIDTLTLDRKKIWL